MGTQFNSSEYACVLRGGNQVTFDPRRYEFEDANHNGKLNTKPNGETELFDLKNGRYVRADEGIYQCYKKLLKDTADRATTRQFYAVTQDSETIDDSFYGPQIYAAINEFSSQQEDHSVTMRYYWYQKDPNDQASPMIGRIELMLGNGLDSSTIVIEGETYRELFDKVIEELK